MSFSSICSQNRSSCAEQKRLSQKNQAIGYILASLMIISGLSVANSEVVKLLEGKNKIFEKPPDETHERNLETSRQLDNSKSEILTITPGITTYGFIMEKETLLYRLDTSKFESRDNYLVIFYQSSDDQIIPQLKIQANSSGAYLSPLLSQQMPKDHLIYEIRTFNNDNVILELQLKEIAMLHDKSPQSNNFFFNMKISNSNTVNELTDNYELMYLKKKKWASFKSDDDRKRVILVKYKTTDHRFIKFIFSEQQPGDFQITSDNQNKLFHSIDRSTLYVDNSEFLHEIVFVLQYQAAFLEIKKITMPDQFDQFYSKMILPKAGYQYYDFKLTRNEVEYQFEGVRYEIISEMNFSNIHFVYHAYLATSIEALIAIIDDREIIGDHEPALHQIIKPVCEWYACRDKPKHKVVFPNSETSIDKMFIVVRAELIFEQANYDKTKLTQEPVSFFYSASQYDSRQMFKDYSRNKLFRRDFRKKPKSQS